MTTTPAQALRLVEAIPETRENYAVLRELSNVLRELMAQTLERTKEAGA